MNSNNSINFENAENIMELIGQIPEISSERRTIMFLIDGLGVNNLSVPRQFKRKIYTTVFPSSTATFFYSFHSLLPPKRHGFLEWYMRFKDLKEPIAIPPWETVSGKKLEIGKDIKREDIFPFKSLSETLWKKGLTSCYYTPYSDSAFTKVTSRRSRVVKISYLSQVFPLYAADFTFIYWPSIDSILHEEFKSEAFYAEIRALEFFIRILWKKIPYDSNFLIISDHGLIEKKRNYLLPIIEEMYPVGGSRVAFYKNVSKDTVAEEFKKRKIPAKIFEINELEEFKGSINERCYENFGNIIAIAKNNVGFKYPFEKGKPFKGGHGGKSKEEIYVNVWMGRK